jgi:RimJ/RimL family protein N-acetyltransferase
MKIVDSAITTFCHLRESVHSQYGGGIKGYLNYLYISMFRVNSFLILSCSNNDETLNILPASTEIVVKRTCMEEIDELRNSNALPREFYGDHLLGSNDFFLAFGDGQPAYIHWVLAAGEQSRFLQLGANCAEISYMLTVPEYRGKRLCSQVMSYTVEVLRNEGVKKVFCVIHEQNIASLKAAERAGFKFFGKIKSIGPLNFRMKVTAL